MSSIVASLAIPKLKWLAAGIGGGLTYGAVSDSCAMGMMLSKLPYNRGPLRDARTIVAELASSGPVVR